MLIKKLSELETTQYLPVHETSSSWKPKKIDEEIWDVLGAYDPHSRTVILYDKLIHEKAVDLHASTKFDEKFPLELILREEVRLHEHGHAFLHTATIEEGVPSSDKWYRELSRDVNEPLTEFLAFCIVSGEARIFKKVFKKVNPGKGSIYQKYKEILEIFEGSALYLIPPLVKFARKKIRKDWKRFKDDLIQAKDQILSDAVVLAI